MTEEEEYELFSLKLILRILTEYTLEDLREIMTLIQLLVEKDYLNYTLTPDGIKFTLNTEFEEEMKLKIREFDIHEYDFKNIIFTIFKVIMDYVENNGKKKIKEILPLKDDELTIDMEKKLLFLENFANNSNLLLFFIHFESFIKNKKFENIDFNVNIRTINFYKETTPEFLYFPVGELNLIYYDQHDNKSKMLQLMMTKRNIKQLKETISDFYDEFIIQEDFVKGLKRKKSE